MTNNNTLFVVLEVPMNSRLAKKKAGSMFIYKTYCLTIPTSNLDKGLTKFAQDTR